MPFDNLEELPPAVRLIDAAIASLRLGWCKGVNAVRPWPGSTPTKVCAIGALLYATEAEPELAHCDDIVRPLLDDGAIRRCTRKDFSDRQSALAFFNDVIAGDVSQVIALFEEVREQILAKELCHAV